MQIARTWFCDRYTLGRTEQRMDSDLCVSNHAESRVPNYLLSRPNAIQ